MWMISSSWFSYFATRQQDKEITQGGLDSCWFSTQGYTKPCHRGSAAVLHGFYIAKRESCEHHNRLSKFFRGCSCTISASFHKKCSRGREQYRRMLRTVKKINVR